MVSDTCYACATGKPNPECKCQAECRYCNGQGSVGKGAAFRVCGWCDGDGKRRAKTTVTNPVSVDLSGLQNRCQSHPTGVGHGKPVRAPKTVTVSVPAPKRPVIVSESGHQSTYHYWQDTSPIGLLEARAAILELVPSPGSSCPLTDLDSMQLRQKGPQGANVYGALQRLIDDRVVDVHGGRFIRLKY